MKTEAKEKIKRILSEMLSEHEISDQEYCAACNLIDSIDEE